MSRILDKVKADLEARELKGLKTYGTTVDREDYSLLMWLTEAYEEVLDLAVYLKCSIEKIKNK